jgi:hypothetical protein
VSKVFDAKMGRFARMRMDLDAAFDHLMGLVQDRPMEDIRVNVETAALRAGVIIKDETARIYREGDPSHKANHPWRVLLKGSSQPLFELGELAKHVRVKVLRKSGDRVDVVVDLPPGKQAMKAFMAENGWVIKVTPKMRKFLFMNNINIKRSTTALVVPPRPVFRKAVDNKRDEVEQAIRRQLEAAFGRVFGRRVSVRVG